LFKPNKLIIFFLLIHTMGAMVTNTTIGHVLRVIEKKTLRWTEPSVSAMAAARASPFRVLIATVLSLRTKDEVTLPASERLFRLADTPQSMLRLSPEEIQQAIYPVCFYRNKSRHILGICERLIERYDGRVPDTLEQLLEFKGIGRKTANLVLILGYGKPAMCVDTHVHRISNRLGYIKTKTPDESEMALRKKLPAKHWMKYNDLLVAFGQNQCKPVSPLCGSCLVSKFCPRIGVTRFR
jgi:endonuclease-3